MRLALVLLALSCAAPRPMLKKPGLEPPKTFDADQVDQWVARKVDEARITGASLAVMRDGKLVLVKGYGKANRQTGEPVTPDTAFGIGSITKQFVCSAALLLAEEGKLSMERKVAADFPSITRAADITLLDLFHHVSGYPDFYPLDFLDRRMLKDIDPDALIARYASGKLDFEPGTRWSYSNTGYTIAGRIVERAAGQPIGKLIEDRLFKPAGMTRSTFTTEPGMATGYTSFALGDPEPALREPPGWLYTAGAIVSTAADLARWDLALMEGRILEPESWRTLSTPATLRDGRSTDYGCGLGVGRRDGETFYGHSGAVSGYLSYNSFIPRTRSAVVLLVNGDDVDARPIQQQILRLLTQQEENVPKIDGPPAREMALELLHQLQQGRIDRSRLGEEYDAYLTPARAAAAAQHLAPLGEPDSVVVEGIGERGGMESSVIRLQFRERAVKASLYRTPDGKIQQFLISP